MLLRKLIRRMERSIEIPENPTGEEARRIVEQLFIDAEGSNYRNLKRIARRLRRQDRRTRSSFEKRLMRRWGNAIDLYDLFLIASRQMGEDFNREHRAQAANNQDYTCEALVRIRARACLIASEIRVLMVSGHASGALTRWRSIHELAVVALFVKEHGNDVAERYILRQAVQTSKQMDKYEQHHEALGYESRDPVEREQVHDLRNKLIARCGSVYARNTEGRLEYCQAIPPSIESRRRLVSPTDDPTPAWQATACMPDLKG